MHQTEPSSRHGIEAATATEWDRSLLDELLDSGVAAPAAAPVFDRVRRARTVGEAFRALFGVVPGEERRNELQLLLTRLIASIDELVTA
ncbi:MAG: hypothetical protein KF861_19725, partial [Planctomycetaceae bacterium]|nr:hypothetical protein [Planctomycetaceae bacterium]